MKQSVLMKVLARTTSDFSPAKAGFTDNPSISSRFSLAPGTIKQEKAYTADSYEKKVLLRISLFLVGFRLLALLIAGIQIFFYRVLEQPAIPLAYIFYAASIYTVFKTIFYRLPKSNFSAYVSLTVDFLICTAMFALSNSIQSPLLFYSLTPVIFAALLLDTRIIISTAIVSISLLVLSHLFITPGQTTLSLAESTYLIVYTISVVLTAILPYLVNLNIRKRIINDNVQRERQRLSHELHDGAVQTITNLCWQVQLLERKMTKLGIELPELNQVVHLAEQAQTDTRDSLAFLRSNHGYESISTRLKKYTEYIRSQSGISFDIEDTIDGLHLSPPVENQLLRICQEALNNVRKYSGAHLVSIRTTFDRNRVLLIIRDYGYGFDQLPNPSGSINGNGQGLSIMQERAESVGGNVQIDSMPGRGTDVKISIPLQQPANGRR
jgi:signal transduction histidine kinase